MFSKAFTIQFNGRANVIKTDITIWDCVKRKNTPRCEGDKFTAIWDTGATNSVITEKIVTKCGLQPTGRTKVGTANGYTTVNTHIVDVGLPNNTVFNGVTVSVGNLPNTTDMLISSVTFFL